MIFGSSGYKTCPELGAQTTKKFRKFESLVRKHGGFLCTCHGDVAVIQILTRLDTLWLVGAGENLDTALKRTLSRNKK